VNNAPRDRKAPRREIGAAESQNRRGEITNAVMAGANCAAQSVSVSIEDIEPEDWSEIVYTPDITGKWDKLYKKPGYNSP
jgi:4-oxalocrotonate tautomerase